MRRVNEEALRRRIMYVAPIGQRKTRRSKARCKELRKDASTLGIKDGCLKL